MNRKLGAPHFFVSIWTNGIHYQGQVYTTTVAVANAFALGVCWSALFLARRRLNEAC